LFWESYVGAMVADSALGQIPKNVIAFGVKMREYDVDILCLLSKETEDDTEDLEDILAEAWMDLGNDMNITCRSVVCSETEVSLPSDVFWIYITRELYSQITDRSVLRFPLLRPSGGGGEQ
jgi:hypothetical protein